MTEIKTGIILRRNLKQYFYTDENKPQEGEIVYATDTAEYGAVIDNQLIWVPFVGIVQSVAGKTGHVTLSKFDVNLENVDNTADLDKPLSNLTKIELDKKVSWSDVEEQAAAQGMPVSFVNTTYEIKDGELSEYNFNSFYKKFIDDFNRNPRILAVTALTILNDSITLHKGDGSAETIELPNMRYDDQGLRDLIDEVENKIQIVDNLDSSDTNASLSANQGKILKELIGQLQNVININDDDFRDLNSIIDFINENRDKINELSVSNIIGLQDALNQKVNIGSDINTSPNSDKLGNKSPDEYVLADLFLENVNEIKLNLDFILNQIKSFQTASEVDEKIQRVLNELNILQYMQEIDQQINALSSRLDDIDPSAALAIMQEKIQEITDQSNQLKIKVEQDLQYFNDIIQKFDMDSIQNDFDVFKNEINVQLASIQSVIDEFNSENSNFRDQINEQLNLKVSDFDFNFFKDEVNNKFADVTEELNIKQPLTFSNFESISNDEYDADALMDKITEVRGAYYINISEQFFKNLYDGINDQLVNFNIEPSIISPDISNIDFESFKTEVHISITDVNNFKFIVGDYRVGSNMTRLRAVNTVTNKAYWYVGYKKSLTDNIDNLSVKITNDSIIGKYLDRVQYNANLIENGKAPDDIFERIYVADQDADIEPRDNYIDIIICDYEILNNGLKLIFDNFLPSALITAYGIVNSVEVYNTNDKQGSVKNITLTKLSTNIDGSNLLPNPVDVAFIGNYINEADKKLQLQEITQMLKNVYNKYINRNNELCYWNFRLENLEKYK